MSLWVTALLSAREANPNWPVMSVLLADTTTSYLVLVTMAQADM